MLPVYVALLILHPIWVTLLALAALSVLLWRTGLWARYRYRILATLLALYAIDAAIALPRVLFSYRLPNHPVVAQKVPLPRQFVLVNIPCSAKCHALLISGAIEEVVYVERRRSDGGREEPQAVRYRAGWSIPGACPPERQRAALDYTSYGLLKTGYCPLVEPADVPIQGIFLIREAANVLASERARAFTPTYLAKGPPGPTVQFAGIEVQERSASGVTVLASTYSYSAPGILGLPPLIGCWDRPDNVIWIMPAGDTGCGFWRWFTWGGDEKGSADPNWIYDNVFGPPDRAVVAPKKPELSPPRPAEALEILANAQPLDDYLPGLRDQVLDPSNTDRALTEFVARLARRRTLEGSLIALLAANRPAALVGLAELLNPVPYIFVRSDAVLAEMAKNPTFRDEFADAVFRSLAANWQTEGDVGRFLTLMENSHPGWLCDRLGRLTGPEGLVKARENRTKDLEEAMPPFIPPIIQKTAKTCPGKAVEVMRELLSTSRPRRQGQMAGLVARVAPNLAPGLAVQAVINLSGAANSLLASDKGGADRYSEAHLALLRTAGQSCEMLARNVEAYIRQESEQHRIPSGMLIQNLERIRNGQASEFCTS